MKELVHYSSHWYFTIRSHISKAVQFYTIRGRGDKWSGVRFIRQRSNLVLYVPNCHL